MGKPFPKPVSICRPFAGPWRDFTPSAYLGYLFASVFASSPVGGTPVGVFLYSAISSPTGVRLLRPCPVPVLLHAIRDGPATVRSRGPVAVRSAIRRPEVRDPPTAMADDHPPRHRGQGMGRGRWGICRDRRGGRVGCKGVIFVPEFVHKFPTCHHGFPAAGEGQDWGRIKPR